jgi:hypothetical protein
MIIKTRKKPLESTQKNLGGSLGRIQNGSGVHMYSIQKNRGDPLDSSYGRGFSEIVVAVSRFSSIILRAVSQVSPLFSMLI